MFLSSVAVYSLKGPGRGSKGTAQTLLFGGEVTAEIVLGGGGGGGAVTDDYDVICLPRHSP